MSFLLVTLVEPLHRVISYINGTRSVQERQANVVVAHAFFFHPIGEQEVEENGLVFGGIIEGRDVKLLDGAGGVGGA